MTGKRYSSQPTERQQQAMNRNWKVFRLRGLHAQLGMLSPDRASRARLIVDEELIDAGAEPEGTRRDRLWNEAIAKLENKGISP